jgi:Holliday junction resolvase RusA-like endonuclease
LASKSEIKIVVDGTPVGQPRPRVTVRGGKPHGYTPRNKGYKLWEKQVTEAMVQAKQSQKGLPTKGPITVVMTFRFHKPKSVPGNVLLKTTRPDIDNLMKFAMDRMQATGLIGDDAAVACASAAKMYGIPGMSLTIWEAE